LAASKNSHPHFPGTHPYTQHIVYLLILEKSFVLLSNLQLAIPRKPEQKTSV